MDLRPFGLQITLRPNMDLESFLQKEYIQTGSYSRSRGIFEFPTGRYNVGVKLGEGTYGKSFQAIHETNNQVFAVKVIDLEDRSIFKYGTDSAIRLTMIQSIINIILEQESADEPAGPYVPRFFEIALDTQRNYMLLRTERLHDNLWNRYKASTAEENDLVIPQTLAHTAHILDFFFKRLRYNHRDFKPDNVMYTYSLDGQFNIKIIDFGFNCLTWKGIEIKGAEYFKDVYECYLPSRDLTQFIYFLLDYRNGIQLSPRLKKILEHIITFPVGNTICNMIIGCRAYGMNMNDWYDSYDFLNNPKIKNPNAYPEKIRQKMMDVLGLQTVKSVSPIRSIAEHKIPGLEHCPPEQILNPRTRLCVQRNSSVGKKLLKFTRRYKHPLLSNKRRPTAKLKPCGRGRTRNPYTRRCIKQRPTKIPSSEK
jgi:serine/threonine protein kinase